jgi:hypothetical protein
MFVAGAIAAGVETGHVVAQDVPKPPANEASLAEPIELADGLVLNDYRFLADNFKVNFLGEIEHIGDTAFDGQALAATFLDAAGATIETIYPIPLVPVIRPGERIPVTSTFMEFNPLEDAWSEAAISICGDHLKFEYTERFARLDLRIEDLSETKESDSYLAEGVIRNEGETEAESVEVHAIYRDDEDRLIGLSLNRLDNPIPVGAEAAFSIDARLNFSLAPVSNPFAFIEGRYTVELVVSIDRPEGYAIEC